MKKHSVVRRRFSSGERAGFISQYQQSGLTQRAFVQKHKLSLATLTKWLRQHRQSKIQFPARPTPPAFQPIDLSGVLSGSNWAAEIVLPEGTTVRLSVQAGAALTDHLIQTLRRAC